MTYHIDAIYDGGVLRPLVPLVLPDKSRVRVTVESAESEHLQSGNLRGRFGTIRSGDSRSADNERIDADLSDEQPIPRP